MQYSILISWFGSLLQGQEEVKELGKKGVNRAYKTVKQLTCKIVTPKFTLCIKQLMANHVKVQLKQNQFTNFTLFPCHQTKKTTGQKKLNHLCRISFLSHYYIINNDFIICCNYVLPFISLQQIDAKKLKILHSKSEKKNVLQVLYLLLSKWYTNRFHTLLNVTVLNYSSQNKIQNAFSGIIKAFHKFLSIWVVWIKSPGVSWKIENVTLH